MHRFRSSSYPEKKMASNFQIMGHCLSDIKLSDQTFIWNNFYSQYLSLPLLDKMNLVENLNKMSLSDTIVQSVPEQNTKSNKTIDLVPIEIQREKIDSKAGIQTSQIEQSKRIKIIRDLPVKNKKKKRRRRRNKTRNNLEISMEIPQDHQTITNPIELKKSECYPLNKMIRNIDSSPSDKLDGFAGKFFLKPVDCDDDDYEDDGDWDNCDIHHSPDFASRVEFCTSGLFQENLFGRLKFDQDEEDTPEQRALTLKLVAEANTKWEAFYDQNQIDNYNESSEIFLMDPVKVNSIINFD